MSIKYLITRLQILTLSPIFPSLLTFILFTIYKIKYDPHTLCDNGCSPLLLEQLKQNLEEEIKKSTTISNNVIEFIKIIEEAKESSELSPAQKRYNARKFLTWQEMMVKSLKRSTEIEASIRKIDPCFTSGYENINAEILRTLQQRNTRG